MTASSPAGSVRPGSAPVSVAFLDDDHVLDMVRRLLTARSDRDWADLAGFFAPEVPDPLALLDMRKGAGPEDGVTVASSPADSTVLLLRRGRVDRHLFDRSPGLRLVQRLGARRDGIDLAAAHERGIQVSCVPRPALARTAEHTMLLMLALVKRLLAADRAARAGQSAGRPGEVSYNWAGLTGIGGLSGRTLGIIGFGEVGLLVAERARAFGMRVLACGGSRPLTGDEVGRGATHLPIGEVLARADIVSVHAPGATVREAVIGGAEIAAMRPGALLINTSRGWLVDEGALYEALVSGRLGGAGLDVHRAEPRPGDDRFCALDNVVLTPHIAGGSRLDVLDEVGWVLDNIRSVRAGGVPQHGRVETAS